MSKNLKNHIINSKAFQELRFLLEGQRISDSCAPEELGVGRHVRCLSGTESHLTIWTFFYFFYFKNSTFIM
jgi:hypothetical protein